MNRILIFSSVLLFIFFLLENDDERYHDSYVFYFDNSLSSEVGNGFDVSNKLLDELINKNKSKGIYYDNVQKINLNEGGLSGFSDSRATVTTRGLNSLLIDNFNGSEPKDFFIVSDFQNFEIRETLELVSDTSKRFHFVLLDELNSISNILVDSLFVSPKNNDASKLTVRLSLNVFNMPEGNVIVKLVQGNSQLSSFVKKISELNNIEFDIPLDEPGSYRILLDGDVVSYDNEFHFVVGQRTRPKVSIIDGSDKNFVETALGNSSLFDLNIQDFNNLNYNELESSDLIILNGVNKLPIALIGQLPEANFLIFPSTDVSISDYNKFLKFKISAIDESLVEIDLEEKHPLFAGVFNKNINVELLPKLPVPFSVKGDFESIIGYRNGNTFLAKKENIYFFNTVLSSESGFHSDALFLPFLYQIAFSSVSNIENQYYYPGGIVSLAAKLTDNPIRIVNDETELIPTFNYASSRFLLKIPINIRPGVYQVKQGDNVLRSIAINIPKSESRMSSPTMDEMKSALKDLDNVKVSKANITPSNFLLSTNERVSFWKYALILTLLFIFSETMLHRFYK